MKTARNQVLEELGSSLSQSLLCYQLLVCSLAGWISMSEEWPLKSICL